MQLRVGQAWLLHVTGAAALYKAMFPDAPLAEVSAEIMKASTQPDTPCDGVLEDISMATRL
jgi:hypothetical protein